LPAVAAVLSTNVQLPSRVTTGLTSTPTQALVVSGVRSAIPAARAAGALQSLHRYSDQYSQTLTVRRR
jgi:hypothetical protein